MNAFSLSGKSISTSPILAVGIYASLVAALLFVTVTSIADIFAQREEAVSASAMLEQLQERKGSGREAAASDVVRPTGSPFVEGATVTVAGAALLQRVSSAVSKAGGSVLSTQLDVQSTKSKPGFLSMVANFEIDQPALQGLLYDLEAGMPFLFIDQLSVQSALNDASGPDSRTGKLRILLTVSGQWQASN